MLQQKRSLQKASRFTPKANGKLVAEFITNDQEIKQAQRLRYEVFCSEYNISLPTHHRWRGKPIDHDIFDNHCLHLVVRDCDTYEIVGYTRVLSDIQAKKVGGFYSGSEFDIQNVEQLSGRKIEIGRTCIHPDFRNGSTIAILWAHLAKHMLQDNIQFLFGCASISLADGGKAFSSLMPFLRDKHFSDETLRVTPRLPLKVSELRSESAPESTPLLKAYTRMGAKVCGEACWDPEFNVADVFILLDMNNIAARYAKHFLKN